jgi:hypothetical protein
MKSSSKKFELTSVWMYPNEWRQFKAICATEDTSAAARIRGFIRRDIARAARAAKEAEKAAAK